MANWCINYATLTAPSKDEADRFEAYVTQTNGEDLFNYFRPCPKDDPELLAAYFAQIKDKSLFSHYGLSQDELDGVHASLKGLGLGDDWLPRPDDALHLWCTDHWGTRSDVDRVDLTRRIGNSFEIEFGSVWTPPIAFYDYLSAHNWIVEARYIEAGEGFTGYYQDGKDHYFEIDPENLDTIPRALREAFTLDDFYAHPWYHSR